MTSESRLWWVLAAAITIGAPGCDDDGGGSDSDADAAPMGGQGGGVDAAVSGGDGGDAGPMGGQGGGAPPDGIRIDGLGAEVTVWFDDHGVMHAKCASNADCYRVEGYFHAAHRFSQMDIRRRVVRAQLSAVVGDPTLGIDVGNRHFFANPATGDELAADFLASADAETTAALEAYADGVNAWLADMRAGRNGAALTDEYEFPLINKDALRDWSPIDSAGCILALLDSLTNQTGEEIANGQGHADLSPELAADFYGVATGSLSAILPTAEQPFDQIRRPFDLDAQRAIKNRLQGARVALAAAAERIPPEHAAERGHGSNNWVVGPSRATNGHALLSNDPHLTISNPAVWYLVHLDSKTAGDGDIQMAGVSFAGLPGVILGQNEDIAWGATTTYFDMADVYIETLNGAGDAVMHNGMEVPIVEREIAIEVSGAEASMQTLRWVPHHGPIISVDDDAGIAVSLRWVGHEGGGDLNFLTRMHKATTVEEAREALETFTTVGQNWVVADREGSIGWFPYNTVPNRPWASAATPSWLPVPGDGTADWDGFIPYAELPQAIDPPAGFIATANNDMTGALADGDPTNDGLPMLQHYVAFGARHERIVEAIEAIGDQHSRDTMEQIVSDVRSLLGAQVTPMLVEATEDPAGLTEIATVVRSALENWDFQCPTGLSGITPDSDPHPDAAVAASAIGCAAFHVVWSQLRRHTLNDEVTANGGPYPPDNDVMFIQLARPMTLNGEYWDDVSTNDTVETKADMVAKALDSAGTWLVDNLGDDPDDWRWGRIHTITLRADLFDAAGIPTFNHGPFANDGGLFTVDVGNTYAMLADIYSHTSGPSMRFVCEVMSETGPSCTMQIPGGQQHFRDSPHYDDLLQKWLVNESFPLMTDLTEVEASGAEPITISKGG